ncbi:MAG TPA: Ig-like domain-containing protein [Labilithrix sp.]|nr:Ig-like domain-containing protein [Labilithrix sp.]
MRMALATLVALVLVFFGRKANAAVLLSQKPVVDNGAWSTVGPNTVGGLYEQQADNFTVPAGPDWSVKLVRARFTFVAAPFALSNARVVFYNDAGGLPGTAVCDYPSVATSQTVAAQYPNHADWTLDLPDACVLAPGKYWLSIQGNNASITSYWSVQEGTGTSATNTKAGPWSAESRTHYMVLEDANTAPPPVKVSTKTVLASSVNPSVFGEATTLTATVTSGSGTPAGSVTFRQGSTALGTANLAAGVATLNVSTLTVGTFSITATYNGSNSHELSFSPTLSQTVTKANTTTTLASSAAPSTFGQSVTFTATVSPVAPSTGVPTGSVTFKDGANSIGVVSLSGGVAKLTISNFTPGSHTITAAYAGNTTFNASTSADLTQEVDLADTSTTLISSAAPSIIGQSVTFTATVTALVPSVGNPSGTVNFKDGPDTIGTANLNANGVATLTTSALAVGTHAITAAYGGAAGYKASTSAQLTQQVNTSGVSIELVSSSNPSTYGSAVKFTATFNIGGSDAGAPTGEITFKDGAGTLGTSAIDNGVATFTTATLAGGNHDITAEYPGDSVWGTGLSSLVQTVELAFTATQLVSTPNPSAEGTAVKLTATVISGAAGGGPITGTVTFKDGALILGTGPVGAGGVATLNVPALAAGARSITAEFSGDTNYAASTSAPVTHTVTEGNPDAGTTSDAGTNPEPDAGTNPEPEPGTDPGNTNPTPKADAGSNSAGPLITATGDSCACQAAGASLFQPFAALGALFGVALLGLRRRKR